jgi:beta-lactamase superfamily II metal-dependent hydrolase
MFEAVFWDVQHGSAACISTPAGKHIAVDLGTGSYKNSDGMFSPFHHLKKRYNLDRLDAVIMTHPHRDHLNDLENFYELNPYCIDRPKHLSHKDILDGNPKGADNILEAYFKIDDRYNCPVPDSSNPLKEFNNGGVDIQIFDPKECATSNLNNHSLVTVISYAGSKLLIPGDNEEPSWNELLENKNFVKSIKGTDIFVASHHGRKAGFSSSLFEEIGQPYLTIISDGPEGETSATQLYSAKTKGFTVHKRSGGTEDRKCLTTRNDGVIVVKFGTNSNRDRFIDVTID